MMSKDRVHFYFPGQFATNEASAIQDEAAAKAFRMPLSHVKGARQKRLEIICRPSQFARFLIHRNLMGGVNDFKNLEARLVTPAPPPTQPVDVSGNPA
ncbi:hypothetical protein [Brevundimonas phage AA]|uniref:Uncharacterized protein n=1 Tax=Brevundimonas phage AA TaxID=2880937 RepID=A0AAN0MP16_9CAUD|nr:hypothetical protein [Brevundimonas phage BC]UCR90861.1 hypothetical protein [Brevundimonas phage AA]